jgi:Arc/MetJ family transcription regulator
MIRRTTIELDDDLLARARRALGQATARATIEEALRQAVERVEDRDAVRRESQMRYFETLGEHVDLDVLASDEMWR